MFEILNLLYLGATVAAQSLTIVANATSDIPIQEGVRVYAVRMKQQAPLWADHCLYDGVMVEFARDWETVQPFTGNVLPPEPDKPVGYALILTRENCPNKPERPIFNTGDSFFSPLFGRRYVIRDGNRMDTQDYAGAKEESRPKWMPQVLKTIAAEAGSNPVARDFLAELERREQAAAAVPPAGASPSEGAAERGQSGGDKMDQVEQLDQVEQQDGAAAVAETAMRR